MIVSSLNLCTLCRRKDNKNSPAYYYHHHHHHRSSADLSSSSSSLLLSSSSTSSHKMTLLRWHFVVVVVVIASFIFTLADAQSQLPPGPTLASPSPYTLDGSRGPLSVECLIDYPEGDTDFSVDMSIEKTVWDANNKVFINKSICVETKASISGIKCEQTYIGDDELSVKSLTVTFPASSSPYTYYAGNYVCKRRARRKNVKTQTEFVKFQVIDCLTNGITELSIDGQRYEQSNDPISIHLTKEQQSKNLMVVCAGRTLNPSDSASVKLSYQLDESNEPARIPQGTLVETLSVVPADSNYAILAEERNLTVTTQLTFGLGDVGTWMVNCAMEQQPRCENINTNKAIKIDVRIPKPIIECPKKVSPEVVPVSERKAVTAQPGQPVPIQLRANIRCNITDGKVHDPEAQPRVEWTWDEREPATGDTGSADVVAPVSDPAITNETTPVQTPARGYAAVLKIDNVIDKHYRQYRVKVLSSPTAEGAEAELLGEETVDLTAGNYIVSPSSTAVRLGACLLLVFGAMFLQLAPSS